MGKKDFASKLLTSRNEVFAELFNKLLFKEDRIDPASLIESDTAGFSTLPDMTPLQGVRDVYRIWQLMFTCKAAYLLMGLENQSKISYVMPVRNMSYDVMEYGKQIRNSAKVIRKQKKDSSLSSEEYLSRFPKDGKIIPVITLVLNWSTEKWDGPTSLYDMMDPDVLKEYGDYINNYKIIVVSVSDLPDELLESFESEMGKALQFSKYANNKEKLKKLAAREDFASVSNELIATINAMTGSNIRYNEEGGRVNMCQAINEMINDGFNQGINVGFNKGIEQGKVQQKETDVVKLSELMKSKGYSEEEIKEFVSEFQKSVGDDLVH